MTDRKREMGSTICILNGQGLVAPQASLSRVRSNLFQVLQCFDDLGTVWTLHFHATSWNHPFLSLWHDYVRAGQTFPAAFPGQVWPTSQGWRNGQFVQPYRTPKRIRTYQLASKIPSQSGSLLEASISNWDYTNENEEEKLTVRAYFYVLVTRATLESQDHRDTYMQVHQPQVYKVTLPWRIPPERCVSRTRRTQSYHSGHHRT